MVNPHQQYIGGNQYAHIRMVSIFWTAIYSGIAYFVYSYWGLMPAVFAAFVFLTYNLNKALFLQVQNSEEINHHLRNLYSRPDVEHSDYSDLLMRISELESRIEEID